MSFSRSPDKMRVSAAIRRAMVARGMRRKDLAEAIGVTPTMAGFWLQGRYLPSIERATMMADLLDAPLILVHTKAGQVGTCRVCLAPFQRSTSALRPTRRAYCSVRCRTLYHKGVRANDKHPAELAVAAFCQECEPEGICRTEDCALRAFSPFMFVARRAA